MNQLLRFCVSVAAAEIDAKLIYPALGLVPRAKWIAAVLSCVGTPVVHGGRAIGEGLDCVGVPWAAARACGLELPPTRRYGRLPYGYELTNGLCDFCDPVQDDADAHILQVWAGKQPRHVVVPVGDGAAVEAWGKGMRVQRVTMPSRVFARWRVRGVA